MWNLDDSTRTSATEQANLIVDSLIKNGGLVLLTPPNTPIPRNLFDIEAGDPGARHNNSSVRIRLTHETLRDPTIRRIPIMHGILAAMTKANVEASWRSCANNDKLTTGTAVCTPKDPNDDAIDDAAAHKAVKDALIANNLPFASVFGNVDLGRRYQGKPSCQVSFKSVAPLDELNGRSSDLPKYEYPCNHTL